MLYSIIISPIELIISYVFNFCINYFPALGCIGAIVAVSLVINILALPIYNVADEIKDKERKISNFLAPRVKRIKRAFKGDEQFMMLSTYYRQNNYHPLFVLRSSFAILLEIPFFIAAYHYLSNCSLLKNVSFWIFSDLGAPDNLFSLGAFKLNVLPILMTLINVISGFVYTKKARTNEKVQLYLMALFFLVLLYNSPSGLVIYWLLNNLFSLLKNIVLETKKPLKVFHCLISIFLILICHYFIKDGFSLTKIIFICFVLIFTAIPLIYKYFYNEKIKSFLLSIEDNNQYNFLILLLSGVGLSILFGAVLPSNVISTSPIEFSFLGTTDNPVSYIISSFFVGLGIFVFWPCIIYKLFGKKVKCFLPIILFVLFITVIFNVYIFKFDYGNIDVNFNISTLNEINIKTPFYLFFPIEVFILAVLIIFFFIKKNIKNVCVYSLIVLILAQAGVVFFKVGKINNIYNKYVQTKVDSDDSFTKSTDIQPLYHLSKTGKNVIVIFLDRAINAYANTIFDSYPEIRKKFDGFTYYKNTVSFSNFTVTGVPPMFGGYEYSQLEINKRSNELLKDKHNEALMVMPKLFSDAGFDVMLSDFPWPNYSLRGSKTFIPNDTNIKYDEIYGKFLDRYICEKKLNGNSFLDESCKREILNFSFLQMMYPGIRKLFYQNCRSYPKKSKELNIREINFFSCFSSLFYLSKLTDFTNDKNSFIFIGNDVTHEQGTFLNDDFETPNSVLQNENVNYETDDLLHFQANVAAYKQLAKWFDYLKKNNVYDNTRIIIVSDHGRELNSFDHSYYSTDTTLPLYYGALLLVKDFNKHGQVLTSDEFMTNADTVFLAKQNLQISPINPFTGKELIQRKENGIDVYHCVDWNCYNLLEKTQFEIDGNQCWHVSNDIYDSENWKHLD